MGLFEITSGAKCRQAASKLGLTWAYSFNGLHDFPGCFHTEDDRNKVYYNLSPNPGRTNLNPNYAAICKGYLRWNDFYLFSIYYICELSTKSILKSKYVFS